MASSTRKVKCPTCGTPVAWDPSNRFRPFCSERCRTIDLGAWAAERHRIAGEPVDSASGSGADPSDEATGQKGKTTPQG
jgi:endogenous inhibitor of DNA gyrase (YacG/DUF329 family)